MTDGNAPVAQSYPDISEPLLPCPFCGGEAERFDDHDTGSTNEGGSCICCKRCNASTAMHFDRKENLVSSWNDRRRDAQAADIFKELGEPDHKLARWSHGAPAFEMWSRESIEAALLRVATQPLGVAQSTVGCGDLTFGTFVENIAASDRNPIKRGIFIRKTSAKMAEYATKEGCHSTPLENLRPASQVTSTKSGGAA